MKLCLIAPTPPPYGGVTNWEQILEKSLRRDEDIELSIIDISPNKRPVDGRTIFDRVFYGTYTMFRSYIELKKLIYDGKVEIVHMATSGGLGFFRDLLLLKLLKKRHIPVLYHLHFGRTVHYYDNNHYYWNLLLKATSISTHVLTIDKKTDFLLKKFIDPKKISCIYNPIETDLFKELKVQSQNTIVYVGSIIKEKGIEELIQAFQLFISHAQEKYTLELVGQGKEDYINYLKTKYGKKNISYVGEVCHEEAMLHIAAGKLFVLPSYTEGSPNVILEAMVLKKPIIASEVGSIPYMLAEESGVLVEPQNVDMLASVMKSVLLNNEKMKMMGENAKHRVIELFDVCKIYQEYKKLWRKMSYEEKNNFLY